MAIYVKSTNGIDKLYSTVKLYDSAGDNTDGSMTQKAVTDKLSKVAPLDHKHAIADMTDFPSSMKN